MLTYAYACDRCGEFEVQQSITEARLETCPECGDAVRRLISGGSGFVMGDKGSFGGDECGSCSTPTHCGSCGHGHSHAGGCCH